MKNLLALFAIAGLLGTATLSANASTSLGAADGWNAMIFGDLNSVAGDTEGKLAVGGNMSASSYGVGFGGVGSKLPETNGAENHLVVGGDLNAAGGWQVYGGNTVVGGNVISSPTYANPNNQTLSGNPIDFQAAYDELSATSQYWSTLDQTGTVTKNNWSTTLDGTGLGDFVTFNITADDIASVTRYINVDAVATVLINVSGTNALISSNSFFINGDGNNSGANNAEVIFNFFEAEDLTVRWTAFNGTLLAPDADLELYGGGINGQAIVASAYTHSGGEFHNFSFDNTNTPEVPDDGPAAVVPSPAAVWVGLSLLGSMILRRNRRG